MKALSLSHFPMIELTVAALIIFLLFFLMTCIRTFSARNREAFAKISNLPLEEGRRHVGQQ